MSDKLDNAESIGLGAVTKEGYVDLSPGDSGLGSSLDSFGNNDATKEERAAYHSHSEKGDAENLAQIDSHYIHMEDETGELGKERPGNVDCDHSETTIQTADGISDVTGFVIVLVVTFLGNMGTGIFFPTLWPLIKTLGGSSVTLGYAVSAYFVGHIIATPVFGKMSETHGYSKTLLLANLLTLSGGLAYTQVLTVGTPAFVIFARTILGIGSGTVGTTRAFASDVTAQRNRTKYMGWLVALQYAGQTITPFLGSVFVKYLGEDREDGADNYPIFNEYTAPAYLLSILTAITVVVIYFYFKDAQSVRATKKKGRLSRKRSALNEFAASKTFFGLLERKDACVLACVIVNISSKGVISAFETLGIKYAANYFDLSSAHAGLIVSLCGGIGSAALLAVGGIEKFTGTIDLLWFSMLSISFGILSLVFLPEGGGNSSWRFVFGCFFVYGIGYPLSQTTVLGLFSKLVGRVPQGNLQGWMATAGALSRVVFSLIAGYIDNYFGISYLFWLLIILSCISAFGVIFGKDTLARLSEEEKRPSLLVQLSSIRADSSPVIT